jgi:glycosyltransferase involved in cell wall biosynthesis
MMKIAQISPLCEAVPPVGYGGTERVVAYLTDALLELGCEVTLFASADSGTAAQLVPMRDCALRLDSQGLTSETAAHLVMLKQIRERAHEFDVLHFHLAPLHLPLFEQYAHRTVTTLHGRLDFKDYPPLYRAWPQYPLVSISHRQRAPLPDANWLGTVHHGLPLAAFPFTPGPTGSYLAFLGRLSREKRPHLAIKLALRAGVPLKIAAKIDDAEREYFEESIRPLLGDPLIEFVGEIGEAEKLAFLRDALAMLFPIDWPEPFGLVMIESLACGTPVIAWNQGSVPEVIDHGITGHIVDCEQDALAAIEWARSVDRAQIRQVFERRFSSHAMARRYLELYRKLLRQRLHDPAAAAAVVGAAATVGRGHSSAITTGAAGSISGPGFGMSAGA